MEFYRIFPNSVVDNASPLSLIPTEVASDTMESEVRTLDNDSIGQLNNNHSIDNLSQTDLEQLARDWMRLNQKSLALLKQDLSDNNLIAEYEFWNLRETELKNLLENMDQPFVHALRSWVFTFSN